MRAWLLSLGRSSVRICFKRRRETESQRERDREREGIYMYIYISLKWRGLGPLVRGAKNSGAKTAHGVSVQFMVVLGDLIDTIRQQCAKFDSAPSPTS